MTQKGNVALVVYAAPQRREGVISQLFSSNKSFMTWPRHYFEAEVRMTSAGVRGPPPSNLPGTMVAAVSEQVEIDGTTREILQRAVVTGEDKNSWWMGLRDSCYVGVYCSHESSEVFSEESGFPLMQMFAEDPKNVLPRRVCLRPNHAWVVAVGDSLQFPTFADFMAYCLEINVHVERHGSSSYEAKVNDGNWELSASVSK